MTTNLGMYIEQLVDRTSLFYWAHDLGFIEKRQIPIKVLKHINETTIVAKLTAKAKVDYFGYINNHYIEFECKQTMHEYFDIALIKHHQLDYLKAISAAGCKSFVLIYFEKYSSVVAISYSNLMLVKKEVGKNALPYFKVVEHGCKLDIVYPGILDIKKII